MSRYQNFGPILIPPHSIFQMLSNVKTYLVSLDDHCRPIDPGVLLQKSLLELISEPIMKHSSQPTPKAVLVTMLLTF